MDKRFLSILGAIIIIFGAFFLLNQNKSTSSSGSAAGATNHTTGVSPKNVTFVEYGDFECPVCFSYYQPFKEAAAQTTTEAVFQFRNLPLSAIHPNAFSGARAAEAAGLQGKYWEMHDLLYENQDPTGKTGWVASKNALEDFYVKFADQLKLNLAEFRSDFASSKVNDSINADIAAFGKTGQQQATPTFFLDGQYIENSKLVDDTTGQVSTAKIVALVRDAVSKKSQ